MSRRRWTTPARDRQGLLFTIRQAVTRPTPGVAAGLLGPTRASPRAITLTISPRLAAHQSRSSPSTQIRIKKRRSCARQEMLGIPEGSGVRRRCPPPRSSRVRFQGLKARSSQANSKVSLVLYRELQLPLLIFVDGRNGSRDGELQDGRQHIGASKAVRALGSMVVPDSPLYLERRVPDPEDCRNRLARS